MAMGSSGQGSWILVCSILLACSEGPLDESRPYDEEPSVPAETPTDEANAPAEDVLIVEPGASEENEPIVSFDKAYTRRSEACGYNACGSATFSITGKRTIRNISMSIKDTYCNGSNAWIMLTVFRNDAFGTYWDSQRRYDATNNSACDNASKVYNNLSVTMSTDFVGVKVQIGDRESWYQGNYVDNPYVD